MSPVVFMTISLKLVLEINCRTPTMINKTVFVKDILFISLANEFARLRLRLPWVPIVNVKYLVRIIYDI